jgi:hypothetical protein
METTRAKVIEAGVDFEESISQIISMLLDVEKDSSISFGYKGASLSFNHRVNLLVDLKFIPKEIISDFQLFAEIRNKFAHVKYIDSFTKCFEIIPEKKNKFLSNWSGSKEGLDDESIYGICFNILCFTLSIWLRVTLSMIGNKKKQELKKTGAIEMMRSFINYSKDDQKKHLQSLLSSITPVVNEIIPDEDFLKSYEELRIKQEEEMKATFKTKE